MIHSWLKHLPGGRSLIIVVPYLWMLLFFLIPFIIVFKISFSTSALSIPPVSYTHLTLPTNREV